MPPDLSESFDQMHLSESDASLGLALVLSALEASPEPTAQDLADELQSLAAIYDTADSTAEDHQQRHQEPVLAVYKPAKTGRTPSPPAEWTPASRLPLRLVLATTLAAPHDSVPLHLLLSLPAGYPTEAPPQLQLQDRYLSSFAVSDALFGTVLRTFMHDPDASLSSNEAEVGVEWTGNVCLFEGVEYVREVCAKWVSERHAELDRGEQARVEAAVEAEDRREHLRERESAAAAAASSSGGGNGDAGGSSTRKTGRARATVPCPAIVSSQPVIDRGSVFVGHTAKVESLEEVEAVMDALLSNSKIARATHNISAYQFTTSSGTRHADNDDDGETAAGSRLAHLLTLMDVPNVMVVVTRWYGGVHLGPDRFKLINQAARDALTDAAFLATPDDSKDKKGKGNKASKSKR